MFDISSQAVFSARCAYNHTEFGVTCTLKPDIKFPYCRPLFLVTPVIPRLLQHYPFANLYRSGILVTWSEYSLPGDPTHMMGHSKHRAPPQRLTVCVTRELKTANFVVIKCLLSYIIFSRRRWDLIPHGHHPISIYCRLYRDWTVPSHLNSWLRHKQPPIPHWLFR